MVNLDDAAVTADGFIDEVEAIYGAGVPLQRFLCRALDLPF